MRRPWARVPLVPTAVIFDLAWACHPSGPVLRRWLRGGRRGIDCGGEGSVGAGTGATVGKLFGEEVG